MRELRAPEAPFTPLALGAAATAFAACGYAVIEFLLGVDAPVSLRLVRDIAGDIALNSLIAVPGLLDRPPLAVPGAARGSAATAPRRAYTTGGLSPLSRP